MAKTDSKPYSFRLKRDAGYALDDLVERWGCNQTAAVERALTEMRDLVAVGGEILAATSSAVPGVRAGITEKVVEFPFHPKCAHCGRNFGAYNRTLLICPGCKGENHYGEPRNCNECVLRQGGA